jgi:hypothetical protein
MNGTIPQVVTGIEPYSLIYIKSGDYLYIGEADPGTAATEEKWRVQRVDLSVTDKVEIKWANGEATFVNKADDMASLTY